MKTTLNIADDVLAAARERALRENRTVGEVISDLARATLTSVPELGSNLGEPEAIFGIRPFPKRGTLVTNELIDKLREGDAY